MKNVLIEKENIFVVVVKANVKNGLVRAIRIQHNVFLFFFSSSFRVTIVAYRQYEGQAIIIIGLLSLFS